jgi:hypothetical protein
MRPGLEDQALADGPFERMLRLAARDPLVRALFHSLLQSSGFPERSRKLIFEQFLAAGADRDDPA